MKRTGETLWRWPIWKGQTGRREDRRRSSQAGLTAGTHDWPPFQSHHRVGLLGVLGAFSPTILGGTTGDPSLIMSAITCSSSEATGRSSSHIPGAGTLTWRFSALCRSLSTCSWLCLWSMDPLAGHYRYGVDLRPKRTVTCLLMCPVWFRSSTLTHSPCKPHSHVRPGVRLATQ